MTGIRQERAEVMGKPSDESAQATRQMKPFFTPFYRNDLDRLLLMRRSIHRYYKYHARHLIAAPSEDLSLFEKALTGNDCELLTQQSSAIPAIFPKRAIELSSPTLLHSEQVRALLRYIESVLGGNWQNVLHAQSLISKYSLYRVFVEEVLKPADLIIRARSFIHMFWDVASLEDFFDDVQGAIAKAPEKFCVVAQSALKIPATEYAGRLRTLLES